AGHSAYHRNGLIRDLASRYTEVLLADTQQTAACNAIHDASSLPVAAAIGGLHRKRSLAAHARIFGRYAWRATYDRYVARTGVARTRCYPVQPRKNNNP